MLVFREEDSVQGCDTHQLCSGVPYYIPHDNHTHKAVINGTYGTGNHVVSYSESKPSVVKSFLTIYLDQDPTQVSQVAGDVVVKMQILPGIGSGSKIQSIYACHASIAASPNCTGATVLGSVVLNELLTAGIKTWTIPSVNAMSSPASTDRMALVFQGKTNTASPSSCSFTHKLNQDITVNGWSVGAYPILGREGIHGNVFGGQVIR